MNQQESTFAPSDWNPQRVIVTAYYDGPTEGFIDLGVGTGIYYFKTVAHDFNRAMRVLKLARVAVEQLESVLASLVSALGPPTWPF